MLSYQLFDCFKQNRPVHQEIQARKDQNTPLFFGSYKIGRKIGHGAFADVYQAQHTQHAKTFALKIINCEEILPRYEDQDTINKLKASIVAEQSNMRKCHSAHIIKIYQSFQNSKCKVYVLQYCNQGNLQDYLKKRGALNQNDAIAILKQIIFGLAEMHRNGIIHRDLKPANILIHNGIFKIADLGFSKELSRAEEVSRHTCLGTRNTMAPEVFKEEPYGLKADIWSMGVIFFLMIQYDCDLNPNQNFKVIERYIQNKDKFKSRLLYQNSITLEVKDFLKRTLEIDQDKRLNWQETLSHPMFAKNQQELSQFFVPNIHEHFQTLKKKKQVSQSSKTNPEEFQEFQILRTHYFQCRKAEYIFKHLILPLEELKMIDLSNHYHLQLLLLLAKRCKTNINYAEQEVYLRYCYKISQSFRQQIKTLKQRIEIKYQYFSELLRDYESKISTIIKDRLRKITDKTRYKQEQKFLNGVEGLDFTKKQQIQFTQLKYINSFSDKIPIKHKQYRQIKNILKAYGKIAHLSQDTMNGASVQEWVKELIHHN